MQGDTFSSELVPSCTLRDLTSSLFEHTLCFVSLAREGRSSIDGGEGAECKQSMASRPYKSNNFAYDYRNVAWPGHGYTHTLGSISTD